ncbi:MAG: hypothetical protein IH956_05375 [Chloroflexi bacterium]|nr:hypothetical protein [Chloroflexota bacterium]
MRQKKTFWPLGAIVLLMLLAACGDSDQDDAPVFAAPSPTPTVLVVPRDRQVGIPSPTAVPEEDRRLALDFAVGHRGLTRDWDRLHADFERWRQAQVACDASSAEVSLRQFAGAFVTISGGASGLPRGPIVRDLADGVASAAEREEEALRQLRDNWRPGDNSLFHGVDLERAAASAVRRQIEDGVDDLRARTAASSRELLNAFSSTFEEIGSDWDDFHRAYDALRADEPALSSIETAARLSALVDQFSAITEAIRDLTTSDTTRAIALALSQAAQDEDLALRRLRGTFQKPDARSAGVPASTDQQEDGETDGTASEPTQAETQVETQAELVAGDPTLFDAFDAQLVHSNTLRGQAADDLTAVIGGSSAANQAAVEAFAEAYDLLSQQWDRFHAGYDDWRASDGGCDREAIVTALGEFSLRLGALADEVRVLPRATFLRPLGELFVAAVEQEHDALRALRNAWRPFDSTVFTAFDDERAAVNRLRRQVAAGVQDLLPRYAISAEEVESGSSTGR